jgi:hypothetical protein
VRLGSALPLIRATKPLAPFGRWWQAGELTVSAEIAVDEVASLRVAIGKAGRLREREIAIVQHAFFEHGATVVGRNEHGCELRQVI